MCPSEDKYTDEGRMEESSPSKAVIPLAIVTVVSVVCMCATAIVVATQDNGSASAPLGSGSGLSNLNVILNVGDTDFATRGPPAGDNPCAGKKLDLPNIECINDAIDGKPQAGANVTKGYKGDMEVDVEPIDKPYWQSGLCPVNVHWHLGAEHYSLGEYDEAGKGPAADEKDDDHRRLAEEARLGYQCRHYDENDARFAMPYEWKHCVDMKVGETYEVHWPHSAAGSCGTVNQYQTPFYDGVFCNLDMDTLVTLGAQDIANNVGVQAQVFTIVNDETYYYPDLMRGMVVDGAMGSDIAYYTGSTTGTSRDNTICSQYSPITWQVDRKCHMVSASSFDKMCADMKAQRDDMSDDLYAHGSRVLVADEFAADNGKRLLRA